MIRNNENANQDNNTQNKRNNNQNSSNAAVKPTGGESNGQIAQISDNK